MIPTKVIYTCAICQKCVEIVALDQIVFLDKKYMCLDCEKDTDRYINDYRTDGSSPFDKLVKSRVYLKKWEEAWESIIRIHGRKAKLKYSKMILKKMSGFGK